MYKRQDGSINYDALPELIEHLLAHHTEALLLAGTTAESPTLTHDEELELFAAVQKIVNGRVPLSLIHIYKFGYNKIN